MKQMPFRRIVRTAILAALVCVATMVITIPSPLGGFLNLGDGIVLLSGWLLGPLYGFAAGGIGSALADLLLGYAYYAPGTFLIKGLSALLCVVLGNMFARILHRKTTSYILSSIIAEIWMVVGYFGYAALFRGKGLAALSSIPGNLAQGAAGVILFVLLAAIFRKYRIRDKFFTES